MDNRETIEIIRQAHRECIVLMGYLEDLSNTIEKLSTRLLTITKSTIEVLDRGL